MRLNAETKKNAFKKCKLKHLSNVSCVKYESPRNMLHEFNGEKGCSGVEPAYPLSIFFF